MGAGNVQRRLDQRRRRRRRSLRLGLAVTAALGLLVLAGARYLDWRSALGGPVHEGEAAPRFVLQDATGRQIFLADYLGRRPVVLVFYMTYG